MNETIIRTDDVWAVTTTNVNPVARTLDAVFELGVEIITASGDHVTADITAERRLSWQGDDTGGGWAHVRLDYPDGDEMTRVTDRSTGAAVTGDLWRPTLVAGVLFGPAVQYDDITRRVIADIHETVDPALVFLGALNGSLTPTA